MLGGGDYSLWHGYVVEERVSYWFYTRTRARAHTHTHTHTHTNTQSAFFRLVFSLPWVRSIPQTRVTVTMDPKHEIPKLHCNPVTQGVWVATRDEQLLPEIILPAAQFGADGCSSTQTTPTEMGRALAQW